MELVFKEMKKEAQNAYSLIFEPNSEFKWNAGEYLEIKMPHSNEDDRGIERYFSISAAPSEGVVMITTRFFENEASSFKKALFELKTGDKLENVKKPENNDSFFNANNPNREYIFLTAGIGITPVRSVIKEYHLNKRDLKGILLYANRDDEYIFGEELERMTNDMPEFSIQKYHGKRINKEVLEKLLKEYDNPIFNISGTYDFNMQMKDILLNQLKIDSSNVKSSSFGKGYSQS
ncbi:hypothetical protein CVU76_02350 [Candidatus Dojkabacteria bacterium HGW-Dojkabacteria-1]|uniref:Oxidoreductase FAD/NAD(P)-binding domain-containing protein n=1 Tax=Candidatus Dojkabacteria bacterium HGW-Dojkabacteria-1 TaxID=2013761 RepID=A0A2N2F3Q6_9BACT|nr:MAG: hypothetical protein CVU76_02350 [Candidatus Dojkabacteria bacterium HGW-Dojkabacteria-1]